MPEPDYTKREVDTLVKDIYETLNRIELQTTKTNGSVARLTSRADKTEKILYVVGTIVGTLLLTNSSELISIFKLII